MMDPSLAAKSAELAISCVKRAAEGGEFEAPRKRINNGGANEAAMKRIAEIVLVLSGMGAMRGGRNPTVPENAMMAEARDMAVAICEELAPKDIVPREAFGAVIDDLGLNRLKEQRLGLRPPRPSIFEKMESSIKLMEESKSFAAQAVDDSPQLAQAGVENHGIATVVSPFSPDKVRAPAVSTGLTNSNLVRNSSSTTNRVDIPHVGSDGRVNVLSKAHVPTGFTINTTTALQPRSNISTKNKPTPVAIEGNSPLYSHATNVQTPSSVFAQVVPGTLPSPHHSIQGTQIINAAHHLGISKIIQKLLYPESAVPPIWSPPSKDYMSKSLTCQMCNLAINEVENMFVCDACEKGFHSKCLQSINQRFVPRGEWYCSRCTTISGGKPFPPKYGRVTRNLVATNTTFSSPGVQSSPENKGEAQDQYASQQKKVVAVEPDKRKGPQGGFVAASSEAKTTQTDKMPGGEVSAGKKKEDVPSSETCPNNNQAPVEASFMSSYAGMLQSQPTLHVERPEVPLDNDRFQAETKDCSSVYASNTDPSKDNHPSASHIVAHSTETTSAGPLMEQNKDGVLLDNYSENSNGKTFDESNPLCSIEQVDLDVGQEKQIETPGIGMAQDSAKVSKTLHCVDWIGDIHEVVEDKNFYQSCQINGVVYKLLDYALIQSSNGKRIPSKIQAMWEDNQTGSRWVAVNRSYFPEDLPATVGHPSAPEGNEVYESNDEITLMAGSIEGPCIILPAKKFGETDQEGGQQSDGGRSSFSCRWFYDKIRGVFRPVPS